MEIQIKPLSPKMGREIPLPAYATPGSAGMDLRACIDEPLTIPAGGRAHVPAGFAMALPGPEYVALVFARSGLAVKHGVALSNGVGVVDSDYRGEVTVGLINQGQESYTIQPGDRVAQMVILPVEQAALIPVAELDETQRGAGGFGSTGKA